MRMGGGIDHLITTRWSHLSEQIASVNDFEKSAL
jgi:hypothetical protein